MVDTQYFNEINKNYTFFFIEIIFSILPDKIVYKILKNEIDVFNSQNEIAKIKNIEIILI